MPRPRSLPARRSCSTISRTTSCSTGTTTWATPRRRMPRSPRPPAPSASTSSTTESWSIPWSRATLYTATQGPHFVRDPLAEIVLKMPKDRLRLITPNVGGGFGMKAFVYPEHALVVWAARKIARPVKWQEDRCEGFVSDNQGRDHVTRAELALDGKGRFLGLRVSILANIGAYLSPFGCFVPTRATDLVSGLYAIGAIHINVKGVCTNTVPVCAYRGAGRPEAAYLLE